MEIKYKGTEDKEGNYKFQMTKKFYACYDKPGESYLPVFPAQTDLRAIRMLEDTVNDEKTEIGKRPEDYRLDYMFEMDMRSGKIIDNTIKSVMEAKELKGEKTNG